MLETELVQLSQKGYTLNLTALFVFLIGIFTLNSKYNVS